MSATAIKINDIVDNTRHANTNQSHVSIRPGMSSPSTHSEPTTGTGSGLSLTPRTVPTP